MNAVLVDTSVWIDFFNSSKFSPEAETLRQLLVNDCSIHLCPVIYQEILQGVRDNRTFEHIKEMLLDFDMLDFAWIDVTNQAIDVYRTLRKKGITIRKSNDCLISAYAILADVHLLHKDRDFVEIAKSYNLKLLPQNT
jgi:predicted nucleic acid-binding protein